MGYTVDFKSDIKKRIKTFIKPDGKHVKGGAEAYFGDPMGSNMGGTGKPDFPDKDGNA